MKELIVQTVKRFLKQNFRQGKTLLLGLSGGPDSLALLHLLIESQKGLSFELHVAHVDHRWRKESCEEASFLKEYVQKLKIPFHLHTLAEGCSSEQRAREERLLFFSSLVHKLESQALILGHHGDDQSETVLKRILEGASLSLMGGMTPSSRWKEMTIWRPLLGHSKKEIYAFLEKRGIAYFEDVTNLDPKFLRARMRKTIFPELGRHFGKEVSMNLRRIGNSMHELKEYLDHQVEKYFEVVEKTSDVTTIDFNAFERLEGVEIKAFFKRLSEQEDFFVSHAALETIYELIKNNFSKRKVISGKKIIEINRRKVAIKNI